MATPDEAHEELKKEAKLWSRITTLSPMTMEWSLAYTIALLHVYNEATF